MESAYQLDIINIDLIKINNLSKLFSKLSLNDKNSINKVNKKRINLNEISKKIKVLKK